MYTTNTIQIAQLNMINNVAMAQSIGSKVAAKRLALQQGHAAVTKLLNDEPVELIEIIKAVLTDGPSAATVSQTQIVNLIQDEKIPLYASIFYDTIDYIDFKLNQRKKTIGKLYDAYKNECTTQEVDTIQHIMARCEAHRDDLTAIKELLKFLDKKYTRESIKNWFSQLIKYEWPTISMNDNYQKYDHWLQWKMIPNYGGNSSNATPRKNTPRVPTKPKKTTKQQTKKKKQPKTPFADAQDINLACFKEVCWFHNWRKEKCNRGDQCHFPHVCSIPGCESTTHRAAEHKSAMK